MARPIPHLVTGTGLTFLALMHPVVWPFLIISGVLSLFSHLLWDTLNWGEDVIYHGWGETKLHKALFLALEILAGIVLLLLAIEQPWLFMGMALAMAWDLDHVLYQISSRTGWFEWPRHYLHGGNKWLNAGYSTPWMRTEKGLWIQVVVIILGIALVWGIVRPGSL